MARAAKNTGNGHSDRLEEAMVNMFQSLTLMQQGQALLQQQLAAFARWHRLGK